jgi:hypothetical protein
MIDAAAIAAKAFALRPWAMPTCGVVQELDA